MTLRARERRKDIAITAKRAERKFDARTSGLFGL